MVVVTVSRIFLLNVDFSFCVKLAVNSGFRLIWTFWSYPDRPFGAIWSHGEPFGVIWNHVEPFRAFKAIWSNLDLFGPI